MSQRSSVYQEVSSTTAGSRRAQAGLGLLGVTREPPVPALASLAFTASSGIRFSCLRDWETSTVDLNGDFAALFVGDVLDSAHGFILAPSGQSHHEPCENEAMAEGIIP